MYGWVVVGAAVVLLAGLCGPQLTFGVFVEPVGDGFGWSRALTSGALSLSTGVAGLVGVLMGWLTDKYGIRLVIAIGTVVGVAAHLLLSTVDGWWEFYLYFGLGVGFCSGAAYTPANAVVSKWFAGEKRVLAIGLALTGMVIGQSALAPAASWVTGAYGWSTAYLMLAGVVLACGVPALLLMGRRPPKPLVEAVSADEAAESEAATRSDRTREYSVKQAARTAPFWMLMVTGVTMAFAFYLLIGHIVPCAEDLDMSPGAAAWILTTSGLGSLVGTVAAYFMTARLGGKWALVILLGVQSVATFLFIWTASPWSFYVVSGVFGFCYGAAIPIRLAMVRSLFGAKRVGAILGWSTLAWQVGGVVGPFLVGYVRDVTGRYDWAFVIAGVLLVVGAVSVYSWGTHKEPDPAHA